MAQQQQQSVVVSSSASDIAFIHQCVYDMRSYELQAVLEAVKHNKSGSKLSLRRRVLSLLTAPSSKTRFLRQKIAAIYKSRQRLPNYSQQPQPVLPPYHQPGPHNQSSQNLLHQYLGIFPSNNFPSSSNSVQQPYYEPPQPLLPLLPPDKHADFEDLPFFKTKETLLVPMYCQNNIDSSASFSGLFYLTDDVRHSIVKSWVIAKQEYKVQIILRFVQIGLQENTTERLPYNIAVSVNDRQCKLPALNIPTKAGITPWRCNVPIDITQQTDLRNCLQNTLTISWSSEPHEYMAAVYVAEKLTWQELLADVKKRPLCSSDATKLMIKRTMEQDDDVNVEYLVASVKDPLSKTKMELPARGKHCVHLQCFDAIQFLQMNELKQTWLCPLCKKKLKFENIEIDEFFLNLFQNPDLSEDCENIIIHGDGSWSEKKLNNYSNHGELKSNDCQSGSIEVFTLTDSDDDDNEDPPAKLSNNGSETLVERLIKSEHIDFVEIKCQTQTKNDNCSTVNDGVLDLSLKNGSSPTTSSEDQSIITLNDDSTEIPQLDEPSHLLNNLNFPSMTIVENNNKDCKPPNNSERKSKKKKHKEKQKENSRKVICTITLD